jgi:hypothetical protein
MPRKRWFLIPLAFVAILFTGGVIEISPLNAQLAAPPTPAEGQKPDCCDASGPCGPPAYSGYRIALIVGNDNYGGVLTKLVNAGHDATLLAHTISPYYSVRCVLNADSDTLWKELDAFRKYLEETADGHQHDSIDGRALFYFAGHGFSIDGENYIVASGTANSKDEVIDKTGVLISSISIKFRTFRNFQLYMVFDACRDVIQGQIRKPDWAQSGFSMPQNFAAPLGQLIIFSTGAQSPAHDEMDENMPTGHGPYMFVVSRYAIFKGLTHGQLLVQREREDADLQQMNQSPISLPGDYSDEMPWIGYDNTGGSSRCLSYEAAVVNGIGRCQSRGDFSDCMRNLEKVCPRVSVLRSPRCSIDNVRSMFSKQIAVCGDPNTPVSLKDSINVIAVNGVGGDTAASTDPELAAATLRFQADHKLASAQWAAPLATSLQMTSALQVRPGRKFTDAAPTAAIKSQIDQIAKSSDAKFTGIGATGSVWPKADLELKLVPAENSATTGPLVPTGPVTVDCSKMPCTADWAMAQVPTSGGPVKAWIPAGTVKPEFTDCMVSLTYEGDRTVPERKGVVALRGLLSSSTCVGGTNVVQIMAVLPEQHADDELTLLRAGDRVEFVRNSLLDKAIDPSRIQTIFVRTKEAGSAAPISVQVFAR